MDRRDNQDIIDAVQEAVKLTVNGKIDGLKADIKTHNDDDKKWKIDMFRKVDKQGTLLISLVAGLSVLTSTTIPLLVFIWYTQDARIDEIEILTRENKLTITQIETLLDNADIYYEEQKETSN